ncbi:MAG: molybdopterin-guanine dinucleotide biosynthesis protein B [Hydrogenophilales bacterium 16-64-46]|nr:MAG: molybdopterin-guanine dinucleotide biosynthesis protein B [Hydrogenophilales bacterium 12-64-13]OYZ05675.1 MAG: molybdopterin-guanine dinucleotide biosynthesis protein B [Hydrogenophilales bacterium 16-64-46]OZA40254.1 MAG: molybdopterin-guanine dinucleotide biosynthesis protein B [Hydrogenophilales bacterium 17-64-34]HQT00805.1 molybdopterin-guanine dinucleotide biosynthesis protein B [Thiobacillus sp.]
MKVFGIAGYSGSGKTTLIERVLPVLAARGLRVAVLKHTHHSVDLDQPGKDSWRAREAGAAAVLLVSDARSALLVEHRAEPPVLAELLARLPPCDLVLVEGWKREPIAKLEVHRAATGKPWLYPDDSCVRAVAADIDPPGKILRIDLNNIPQLVDFIFNHADRCPTT